MRNPNRRGRIWPIKAQSAIRLPHSPFLSITGGPHPIHPLTLAAPRPSHPDRPPPGPSPAPRPKSSAAPLPLLSPTHSLDGETTDINGHWPLPLSPCRLSLPGSPSLPSIKFGHCRSSPPPLIRAHSLSLSLPPASLPDRPPRRVVPLSQPRLSHVPRPSMPIPGPSARRDLAADHPARRADLLYVLRSIPTRRPRARLKRTQSFI
jgi:hypothetical protein